MSINKHIINHEIKLMEMGGRGEILLKRETTISIILEVSPVGIATCPNYPYLEWTSICMLWFIFILINTITTP
jgi:hypothetical protein